MGATPQTRAGNALCVLVEKAVHHWMCIWWMKTLRAASARLAGMLTEKAMSATARHALPVFGAQRTVQKPPQIAYFAFRGVIPRPLPPTHQELASFVQREGLAKVLQLHMKTTARRARWAFSSRSQGVHLAFPAFLESMQIALAWASATYARKAK